MGATTQFSATQAAKAQAFLAKAGFDSLEIFQALPSVLNLAAASNLDLAKAADITSNIMGAFNIKADDTERVANVLARATAGANVDMEQLGETMKFAAPVAKQFGASLEDTAAAAGLLGNIGIQGSAAGTALKNAFLGLSGPSTKAAKLLKAMGVEVADSEGKMFGFAKIMKGLGGKLGQLPQQAKLNVLKELFGKIGIAGGAALQEFAKTGELDNFIKSMSDTSVTAEGMAKTMNKGAVGAMRGFTSALEGLSIAIGDSGVLDFFTDMVKGMTGFIRKISKAHPSILQLGVILGILAAAVGPVLFFIGALIAIMPGLITIAGALGITVGVLAIKFLLIGALIVGLIVVGFLLIKHWDKVKAFMLETWSKISAFMDTKLGFLMQILFPFVFLPLKIIKHWDVIGPFLKDLWTSISETATDVFDGMTMLWDGFMALPDKVEEAWKKLPVFFEGLWNRILNKFTTSTSELKNKLGFLDNLLPDFVKEKLGIGIDATGENGAETPDNIIPFPSAPDRALPASANQSINRSEVKVDFSNLPAGANISTNSTDDSLFNINTGPQGASF